MDSGCSGAPGSFCPGASGCREEISPLVQQVYGWEREAPGGAQGEEMRCVYEQTQEKKKARAEAYLVPQPETHRLAQLNTLDDWMQNEGARSDPAARAAVREAVPEAAREAVPEAAREAVPEAVAGQSAQTASSNGQAVVDYARQFLGNPYVYGGNSLTNGTDCSGFVKGVYAAFGINLPRTSSEQRSVGYAVSLSEIQPGDIVCYSGHVGIYAGNNTLIHASNEETGITLTSPVTYRSVLAVRRIF